MADIQEKILNKYGIDITKENVLKLYKIDRPDLNPEELKKAISDTRKRWTQSVNGANEKNAQRDQERLDKADKYEAILSDAKLRKELFQFYNKGGDKKGNNVDDASAGGTEFAREYFRLIATSKKIRKKDMEFFFEYYQSQKKNKKAILTMLEKDFKIKGLGKDDKYVDEGDQPEGKKKDNNTPFIVNLFQEATILKVRKCVGYFEQAKQSPDVLHKYPKLDDGLYTFLNLDEIENIEQLKQMIGERKKDVYQVRQEKGTEYVPLQDLFNTMGEMTEYGDVVDNIPEFKLLIKYPVLTPYMHSFSEMKAETMKGIWGIASREYAFRDEADFILKYYNPIHDNFGIINAGNLTAVIKKAEKKAKSNKVLDAIDKKLGNKRERRSALSVGARIVHTLVYLPIFIIYFIFELLKAVFMPIRKYAIPAAIALFIGENWLMIKNSGSMSAMNLVKIFHREEWHGYLQDFGLNASNGFSTFLGSLLIIVLMLAVYLVPPFLVFSFIYFTGDELNKRHDWVGYERTLKSIMARLKTRSEDAYKLNSKRYYKKQIPKILINGLCFAGLTVALIFGTKEIGQMIENRRIAAERAKQEAVTPAAEVTEESAVKEFRREQIVPVSTEASSCYKSNQTGIIYDASFTIDNALKTCWQDGIGGSDEKGDGIGETLAYRFADKILLGEIDICNGNRSKASSYDQNNRLAEVVVHYFVGEDEVHQETMSLSDDQELEYEKHEIPDGILCDGVVIEIVKVYSGTKYHDTCMSEIQFYQLIEE